MRKQIMGHNGRVSWKGFKYTDKEELLYSPAGTLLTEYTIAVGGNVGIGTLIIFGSGLLTELFPPLPSDCLRLLLTYSRTFCCKSAGSCNANRSLILTLE
jgi:hypothetical protein